MEIQLTNPISKIKQISVSIKKMLSDTRHHIHQNPELSFQEFETSKFIEDFLVKNGIPYKKMANTGILATIEGSAKGRTVGLRGDMDALPIQEVEGRAYGSKNPGVMHACGHDVHTTCLMGAALILNQLKNEFEGTVKLVFQPGEEKLPGGASIMIAEGVLDGIDVMIGQHVMPFINTGETGFRSGLYMASTDELYCTIKGKGGHGAMPHLNRDPVLMAAQMIVSLQQVVSRNANPIVPSVLSFGKVIANGATNVIPEEVYLEGTFRTLDEKWRAEAHKLILNIAKGVVEGLGGTIEMDIRKGYPFLKNDVGLTNRCRSSAEEYLGIEKVQTLDIWMAAEDFAYYSQEVPSCFYRLGVRNESKGIVHSVHTPQFDIDEDALEIGAGLMAYLAFKELKSAKVLAL